MVFLKDEDRDKIARAIADAERRTSGELVAVVAQHSRRDDAPLLWPALFALVLPGIWLTVKPDAAAWIVYLAQIALFSIGAALLQWTPLHQFIMPRRLRRSLARRRAREQFFARGLHLTRDRTGILIFVSVAEHHVEIIADEGINAVVPPGTWEKAVALFVEEVKSGRVVEGFLGTIALVGAELAGHFPRSEEDVNELSNRLIEI